MDQFYWHKRARESVAQGYLSKEKTPTTLFHPTHARESSGCHIIDAYGKKYVDYVCGNGSNLIGYRDPHINRAVIKKLESTGSLASIALVEEVLASEKLKECFPFVDNFKFAGSSAEACAVAVEIAKRVTCRHQVVMQGHHGWLVRGHEYFGLPQITKDTACFILEPVTQDIGKKNIEKLLKIRERCQQMGAILIFNEVNTGFRYKNLSVSNTHGILPDLIILGKALSHGFSLAAVGGKQDIMCSEKYFAPSTSCADIVSLEACREFIYQLTTKYDIHELWVEGQRFIDKFNVIANGVVKIVGYPTCGLIEGEFPMREQFLIECAKAGILFGNRWYFNFPLIKETEKTLGIVLDVCVKIKTSCRLRELN